jgi:hypothetical protein
MSAATFRGTRWALLGKGADGWILALGPIWLFRAKTWRKWWINLEFAGRKYRIAGNLRSRT